MTRINGWKKYSLGRGKELILLFFDGQQKDMFQRFSIFWSTLVFMKMLFVNTIGVNLYVPMAFFGCSKQEFLSIGIDESHRMEHNVLVINIYPPRSSTSTPNNNISSFASIIFNNIWMWKSTSRFVTPRYQAILAMQISWVVRGPSTTPWRRTWAWPRTTSEKSDHWDSVFSQNHMKRQISKNPGPANVKIRSFKKCVQKKKITGMSFLKVNDRFHLYKKVRFHVRYDGRSVWIFQLSTFWVSLKSTLGHLRMLIDTLIGMRPSKAPVINCWAIKTSAIIAVFLVTRTTLNIPWLMSSTLSFWCRYIRMENEDHDLFWLRSCGGS